MADDLTVEQLYQNVLGRAPDPGGLAHWKATFGSEIDPGEIATFTQSAQAEKPGAAFAPSNIAPSNMGGISSLPAATDYTGLVNKAYTDVLGRAGESSGVDWWKSQLASGQIAPDNFQEAFKKAAAPELSVQQLYKDVLGREYDRPGLDFWTQQIGSGGITPEEKQLFYTSAIPEVVSRGYQSVLGRSADEPGAKHWEDIVRSQNLSPQSFARALATGAQSTDIIPAQQYLAFGSLNYLNEFGQRQPQIEKLYGLEPGSLSTSFSAADLANKNIDELQQIYQQSGANKYQEAGKLFNIAQTLYGMPSEDARALSTGLLQGKEVDSKAKEFYDELLKTGMTRELQDKIYADAAVRAPNSPFFQANPQLLQAYTPISIKAAPKAPGQYGYYNNAPILSATEADKLLGGEVIKGGNNYFGYGGEGAKDDALGWDLRSKYAGAIANGAGIFGVSATNQELTDFDKIEKEIERLGGIKTERDAEGNVRQVVYKDVVDPESGQKVRQAVDARNLFATQNDEYGYDGDARFKTYEQTKDALAKGAQQLGLNPDNFDSVKSLFDAVNDKAGNLYVVTGRANNWDPAVAQAQGITGVGQDRGGINHAQVLYQKVGDKLMPVQTLKTFNFDDPNTSRGFFGDIATGIGSILSVPPIALALSMAGGLPALLSGNLGVGMAAGAGSPALAEAMAGSIFNPVNLGEAILSGLGAGTSTIAQYAPLVGQTALGAGMSGLSTGLMTGDLEKAGISALAGGLGAGVSGGTSMFLKDFDISPAAKRVASEIAGGSAAMAATGQDPGAYALNRILSTGISALTGMGAEKVGVPTKGPEADLFKAMLPVITSKKVNPDDVVRIAQAVKAYEDQKAQG